MIFTSRHLIEVNETYKQHMIQALWISWRLFLASSSCFIHAFVPDCFIHTASNECKTIIDSIQSRADSE